MKKGIFTLTLFLFIFFRLSAGNCGYSWGISGVLCGTDSSTLYLQIGGNPIISAQWYLNNNLITGATDYSYRAYQAGTYKVIIQDSLSNGTLCSDTVSQNIVRNPRPVAPVITYTGSTNICPSGLPLHIPATTGTKISGFSSYGTGYILCYACTTYVAAASDTYYALTFDISTSCYSDTSNKVTTNLLTPMPTLAAPDTAICSSGDTIILTASPSGATSYKWFKGNAVIPGVNTSTYSTTDSGAYRVEVIANGCTDTTASFQIHKAHTPVTPHIYTDSATTFCYGAGSALLQVSAPVNGYNTDHFYWYTVEYPYSPTSYGSGSPADIFAYSSGRYYFYYVQNGCPSDNSDTISIHATNPPYVPIYFPDTVSVCPGSSLTLSVDAGGDTANAVFTWYRGASAVGNGQSYVASVAGSYHIESSRGGCQPYVSNTIQVILSSNLIKPSIFQYPNDILSFCSGSYIYVQNYAAGYQYKWYRNGQLIAGDSIGNLFVNSPGKYYVVATQGTCTSPRSDTVTAVQAPIPVVSVSPPSNLQICGGNPITITASAVPSASLFYLYSVDSNQLVGSNTTGIFAINFAGTFVVEADGQCYGFDTIVVAGSSGSIALIDTEPVAQTTCTGHSFSFQVAATGSNLTYQWQKNGLNIAGATSAVYNQGSAANGDSGYYRVIVFQNCSADTSIAVSLTLSAPAQITRQPLAASACDSSEAVFTVKATGALGYQWKKGGLIINGGTSDTLRLPNVSLADTGGYYCIVTGACGNAVSITVALTILDRKSSYYYDTICAGTAYNFHGHQLTASGIYADTLGASNGCDSVVTLNLTATSVNVSLAATADTVCYTWGPVTLSGDPAGGSYFGMGVTGNQFIPHNIGTGTFTVGYLYTTGTGCHDTAFQTIHVKSCTGITEPEMSTAFNLYPNPTEGQIIIESALFATEAYSIMLTDLAGKAISVEIIKLGGKAILDLSGLSAGAYLVNVKTPGQTATRIVTKQ